MFGMETLSYRKTLHGVQKQGREIYETTMLKGNNKYYLLLLLLFAALVWVEYNAP